MPGLKSGLKIENSARDPAQSGRSPAHPAVSVVVVNWNGCHVLAGSLRSLFRQSYRDFEVIVVDNGSTDGTKSLLNHNEFRQVTVVWNSENRGFCAANNQGIRASRGRFVALLNNDAEAEPEWLAELVAVIERDPRYGMAASKIVMYENIQIIDKAGHLIYPDGQNRGRGSGELDAGQYGRIEEVAWPDGCAALYRRAMLDEIGGFDEDFFAYADDAELGLRARIAGWKAVYAPGAIVRHRLGSTLGRYSEKRLFLIERNRTWLVLKLFPLRMWPLVPFFFALRMAATGLAALRKRGDAGKASGELSVLRLIHCVIRANLAAWRGAPRILAKRRELAAVRRLRGAEVAALLRQYRIPLADLVAKSS